ncbi:head-tail connector protein [uncultured Roseobacter sp.]|uniref:head-tail connector protein n=1 Tax=uncultured Roseobacter sp. TaxID=114847 RepID=UPI0026082DDF|nr:head-tail connector protein [uncultured Roseobacter sp.]
MSSRAVRIADPVELPVSRDEFKGHMSIDFDDDDALLDMYLQAATDHLDGLSGLLGRCMVTQTWRVSFSDWADAVELPLPDVSDAVLTYVDTDGEQATVADSLYSVVATSDGTRIQYADEFTRPSVISDLAYPIAIDLTAGYGLAISVPSALKVAVMAQAARLYHERLTGGDGREIAAVRDLIAPYRWHRI